MESKARHREVIELIDSTTSTEGKDSAAKGTPGKVESFYVDTGKGLPLRYEDEIVIEEVIEERRTDSSVIVEDPAVIK